MAAEGSPKRWLVEELSSLVEATSRSILRHNNSVKDLPLVSALDVLSVVSEQTFPVTKDKHAPALQFNYELNWDEFSLDSMNNFNAFDSTSL
jgi:hypothetical protein